ncbi:MAG: Gfo/Idh/MocA family oxidoreductase [Stigonema ocellatum SAG 48.90 = DSM 106950]|nr:Gfo/Idh/MocA family oxidoreductase [Stigonema ocellatum SAG 48.90 = DSM 106950]
MNYSLTNSLSQVKIGIVGFGYWGPKLARNFSALAEVDLSMLCDLEKCRLEEIQRLYPNARATDDFTELLKSEIDAVVIVTPVKTHYSLVKAALEAGKHVLVEKPMTASLAQAQELSDLAKEKNLVLLVGHTFEYSTAVQTVQNILNSGELGEIVYIDSTRGNLGLFRSDVNVVWDLATHDISIIYFLLKKIPISVSAYGKSCISLDQDIHDIGVLVLDFPGNILSTIRVSWLEPEKIRRMTIVGTQKMLIYDDTAPNPVVVYDRSITVNSKNLPADNSHISYHYGLSQSYPIENVEALHLEAQHFIDCIKGRVQPKSSSCVSLEIIRVLEAAQYSLSQSGMKTYLSTF